MTAMTARLTSPTVARFDPSPLRAPDAGHVVLPGDTAYDDVRTPWNLSVDQRPAAVALPTSTAQVAAVVRAAADAGLRVAPQGTGHNAGPLGALDDVLVLRTSAMTGAVVDPDLGRMRVRAGTLWEEAVQAAATHGRTVLHGSSPDVGVVGYSLGAGIGWYARQLGMQTNNVTGAEVVLADGRVVWADADRHTDLFWALRGGGGNFGVVTALEFRTYDFSTTYGGILVWDWRHAETVLSRWAQWAVDAPDAVTTSFRLLQLPPLPDIPESFRGRQLVVIDGAVTADDDRAAEMLAPLRELGPELDTFGRVPTAALSRLHMDPEGPTPEVSDTANLAALPAGAIDALLAVSGPGSGSSLFMTELRQLGGALGRPAPGAGVLPRLEGQFILLAGTLAPTPEAAAQGLAEARAVTAAMGPWANGRRYLNFAEDAVDAATGYDAARWQRLRTIRAAVDPGERFVANHRIPVLHRARASAVR